jgi:dCTP deaminase
MRLLADRDINAALRQPNPIARGIPLPLDTGLTRSSQVQAASLNFAIGDIFIPGTGPDDLGGSNNPRTIYELKQGHTAVIRTRETIHLSPQQAAIGFPPASQSFKGLLMTNPGHIDAGYNGPLHCTVINMAHSSFHLERGDIIMRILIFELDAAVQAPYYARHHLGPNAVGPSPIGAELLDRLSIDFVDVEKRAIDAAEKEINKAQVRGLLAPIGAALLAGALSFGATYFTTVLSLKDEFHKFREDYSTLRTKFDQYEKYDDRLKKVEDKLNAPQPSPQQNRNPP